MLKCGRAQLLLCLRSSCLEPGGLPGCSAPPASRPSGQPVDWRQLSPGLPTARKASVVQLCSRSPARAFPDLAAPRRASVPGQDAWPCPGSPAFPVTCAPSCPTPGVLAVALSPWLLRSDWEGACPLQLSQEVCVGWRRGTVCQGAREYRVSVERSTP